MKTWKQWMIFNDFANRDSLSGSGRARHSVRAVPPLPPSWTHYPFLSGDSAHPFIEVNLDVLRRPARGNNIEPPVAIQIRQAQVFTSHIRLVNGDLLPVALIPAGGNKQFESRFALGVFGAPADDDLI